MTELTSLETKLVDTSFFEILDNDTLGKKSLNEHMHDFQVKIIQNALDNNFGVIAHAAMDLNIARTTLQIFVQGMYKSKTSTIQCKKRGRGYNERNL